MRELARNIFDIYALALPRGHDFALRPPIMAWTGASERACGAIRRDESDGTFGVLVMRRRIDDVWAVVCDEHGFATYDEAEKAVAERMRESEPPEDLPPQVRRRASLGQLEGRTPSDVFKALFRPTHEGARWVLNQLYLSMPNPDANWAADCQTGNFHTRLWEAHLLGSLREQGLLVTQPVASPDFHIANPLGEEAWIEAVTANPAEGYNHVNAPVLHPPDDNEELFFGAAALRFAKTIGSKLDRRYAELPHVAGKPFALALADFQGGASMLWSRQSLVGYLYGEGAHMAQVDGRKQPRWISAAKLKGPAEFAAGLFRDARAAELSAVIFTNACSIAKLNRYMITRGMTPGVRVVRFGEFFDRAPGAYQGVPFRLDVASEEYRRLWPQQNEPWTAEMEVFHNPFARQPFPFSLMPEATHWFELDGELQCSSAYETSILWSMTLLEDSTKPMVTIEEYLQQTAVR